MSRSRKKHPIYKDSGQKYEYNRMFRRINKQLLKDDKELKLLREVVNDYDICDWWWYNTDDDKLYRK